MISSLSFEDVAKVGGKGQTHSIVTVSTFDGLVITLTIVRIDGVLWVTTEANYDVAVAEEGSTGEIYGAPADGKLEADLYNDRHADWQYRLKNSDLTTQTRDRDDYLDKVETNLTDTP